MKSISLKLYFLSVCTILAAYASVAVLSPSPAFGGAAGSQGPDGPDANNSALFWGPGGNLDVYEKQRSGEWKGIKLKRAPRRHNVEHVKKPNSTKKIAGKKNRGHTNCDFGGRKNR